MLVSKSLQRIHRLHLYVRRAESVQASKLFVGMMMDHMTSMHSVPFVTSVRIHANDQQYTISTSFKLSVHLGHDRKQVITIWSAGSTRPASSPLGLTG